LRQEKGQEKGSGTDKKDSYRFLTPLFPANRFWREEMTALTKKGWDLPLAYLKLLLDDAGEGKPLGNLTNAELRSFGATLDFYPGIPQGFEDLEQQVQEHETSRPSIEFYILSGGLEEIIRGSKIAKHC